MGLEGLGADGWRHSPKNRGHPQRPAPDDQKAKIFATLASIPPPFSCDASWRRDPRAGGRRIRISPARSRRTSSLPAVIGYHCLPPRRIGSLRRFNFPRHSVMNPARLSAAAQPNVPSSHRAGHPIQPRPCPDPSLVSRTAERARGSGRVVAQSPCR